MSHDEEIEEIGSELWMPPDAEAAREFLEFSSRYDLASFEERRDDLERAYQESSLRCLEGRHVANFLLRRKAKRRPTCCVRISDGEGNLLPLEYDFEMGDSLLSYCVEKISYMHFGEKKIVLSSREDFADLIRSTIDESDLLGFPKFETIVRGFHTPYSKIDVRALSGNRLAFMQLHRLYCDKEDEASCEPRIHADAWFSRGLLPYYSELLQHEEAIGLISSYPELTLKLRAAFGIAKIDEYRIPRQAIFFEPSERKNTQHYPGVMNKILENLRVRFPGQIFLVAAGLLGKRYCVELKRRGGIAIDIGSVAEVWLGIRARGIEQSFIDKWRL